MVRALASHARGHRFKSCCLHQKEHTLSGCVLFGSLPHLQQDLRDELPLNKALLMPFRGEKSKRIRSAFAVTERKENRTLREKSRFVGTKRVAPTIAHAILPLLFSFFYQKTIDFSRIIAYNVIDSYVEERALRAFHPASCLTADAVFYCPFLKPERRFLPK